LTKTVIAPKIVNRFPVQANPPNRHNSVIPHALMATSEGFCRAGTAVAE